MKIRKTSQKKVTAKVIIEVRHLKPAECLWIQLETLVLEALV